MRKSGVKVLIAAGGSGGHIFPAIALAQELKATVDDIGILFVGSNKVLDKRIFEREGFRYALLSANRLPYKATLGYIFFLMKLLFDILKSLLIVASYRADVAVGFGGYVSGPVMVAAYIFGIPRIVHEQNVVPGRANAFSFRFADRIAVSFDETRKHLVPYGEKTVFTGNPIRRSILKNDKEEGMKIFGLDRNKFTILVIGGSQGAHLLNSTVINALAGIDEKTISTLQVIHITGVKDYEWARASYEEMGLESRVYSFIDRIEEAYSASDLVVTRSGASAIFEAASLGRPMILIPYPYAMSHQIENARVFSQKGAAIEMDEKDLSAELLKEKMLDLLRDETKIGDMARNAKGLSVPASSGMLVQEVLKLAGR